MDQVSTFPAGTILAVPVRGRWGYLVSGCICQRKGEPPINHERLAIAEWCSQRAMRGERYVPISLARGGRQV